MLQAIEQDPGKETLARLADLLYDHIRFEERKLFKYVEEKLTTQQLDTIHEQLSATPACDTEWKDEFWLKR
ncbi:MAG: hypothetical protein HC867_03805 [Bacteroidia bacterium]|nr:hypothetical protein [Bacteroidia bacterium]